MVLTVVVVAVARVVADASVVVVVVVAAIVVDVSIGKVVVTAGKGVATVVVVAKTVELVVVVVGKVAIQYRSYMSRASDWYSFARIA